MSDFTPIETQEAFDAAVKDRLERQEKKIRAEYEDLQGQINSYKEENGKLIAQINDLTEKQSGHDSMVAELNDKIAGYEKTNLKARIAREAGLPYELAERLTGDDEDALKADAESLKELMGSNKKGTPPASPEPPIPDGKDANWKKLAKSLSND